ncbi:MAG: c-type cytochrome [Proteobacteria bacterium]|nr:c-type cytochrome [Pseudomonadota bacterium]
MKSTIRVFFGLFLAATTVTATQAIAADGENIFQAKNCLSCHYTAGPAREKSIADQLAKKGPELWYAGSKFQSAWLQQWLQDPKVIRPLLYNSLSEMNPGNHARLSADDAAAVSEFLMSLVSAEVEAGVITPKNHPKGRLIFRKKMPCSGCHQFPDRNKISGGMSGPSLVGAGSRLNPDWIYAYLMSGQVFKPVKDMPTFTGLLRETDIKALAAYIATFE